MSGSHHGGGSNKQVIAGILLVIVAYVVLVVLGLPQEWTKSANEHHGGEEHAVEAGDHEAAGVDHDHQSGAEDETVTHESGDDETVDGDHDEAIAVDGGSVDMDDAEGVDGESNQVHDETEIAGPLPEIEISSPPVWTVLPFALLLLCIAVLPLIPATEHWWESNLHRFYVACALALISLVYYLILHNSGVSGHWPGHHVVGHNTAGMNFGVAWTVFANAIFGEYIAFIVLLFSLYSISGGIRIEGDLRAHPMTNMTFIAIGGLLASFIGTTGAAMLLIRPLLETNRERKHVVHTVIFFIFVVCNCGGCLLPIGDPPLFLGYLRGVPFLWTLELWPQWLFVNGLLLAVYFFWDAFICYPHEQKQDIQVDEKDVKPLRILGLWPNALLLLGVVLSVALLDPTKPIGGWHPWYFVREVAQLGLVGLSLVLGSMKIREANNFNFHAIIEVAALFFGIFICMQAPLQILHEQGPQLGLNSPMAFFWATGGLSSVLDNAPTYVVFFTTAQSLSEPGAAGTVAQTGVQSSLLIAISLGAVFMGAMTYIGNGPNFMVKAIAEQSGVKMPSFFGYMLYSCGILLPILFVTMWLFTYVF